MNIKNWNLKLIINALLSFIVLSTITLFFMTADNDNLFKKVCYLFIILVISIIDAWLRFVKKGI